MIVGSFEFGSIGHVFPGRYDQSPSRGCLFCMVSGYELDKVQRLGQFSLAVRWNKSKPKKHVQPCQFCCLFGGGGGEDFNQFLMDIPSFPVWNFVSRNK